MKFSTRTTYGLRAIINLAKNFDKDNVSLASIAKAENISLSYLERIFVKLKKAEIVKAERGMSGGYRLSKDPSQINMFEVIKVLEGDISTFHCLRDDGKIKCISKDKCGALEVLSKVQSAINKTLKSIKLKDLI